jgi:hypothetical protein
MKINNMWTGKPETIADILQYRREAGYTVREDIRHLWETRLVWKVLRLVPREIKYWTIVQAASRSVSDGSIYTITYDGMLKSLDKK